jgi:uncharacterized protein (DUF427 family)
MARAIWRGNVIAQSDDTVVVEGNHYFPRSALDESVIRHSDTTSFCPWKGTASYFSLEADGRTSADAVWYYAEPKRAAEAVRGRVAFWKDVEVTA